LLAFCLPNRQNLDPKSQQKPAGGKLGEFGEPGKFCSYMLTCEVIAPSPRNQPCRLVGGPLGSKWADKHEHTTTWGETCAQFDPAAAHVERVCESQVASMASYAAEGSYGFVPDIVKQFVVYFYRHIRCMSLLTLGECLRWRIETITPPAFLRSTALVHLATASFVLSSVSAHTNVPGAKMHIRGPAGSGTSPKSCPCTRSRSQSSAIDTTSKRHGLPWS
jgi:hypothetical protein